MKNKIIMAFSALTLTSGAAVIFEKVDLRIGSAAADPLTAQSVQVDINGDGMTDWSVGVRSSQAFSFVALSLPHGITPSTTLFIHRTPEIGGLRNELAPLTEGALIGNILDNPNFRFLNVSDSENTVLGSAASDSEGPEYNGPFFRKAGYLGFRFDATDGSHFGYAFLENVNSASAVISSYAWESEPGKGIIAGAVPEPASASLLALGVLAFGFRRRRSQL